MIVGMLGDNGFELLTSIFIISYCRFCRERTVCYRNITGHISGTIFGISSGQPYTKLDKTKACFTHPDGPRSSANTIQFPFNYNWYWLWLHTYIFGGKVSIAVGISVIEAEVIVWPPRLHCAVAALGINESSALVHLSPTQPAAWQTFTHESPSWKY